MTSTNKRSREAILEEAHQWRLLLDNPDLSAADRDAFETWYETDPSHSEIYDFAVTMHHAFDTLDVPDIDDDMMRPSSVERLLGWRHSIGQFFSGTGGIVAGAGSAIVTAIALFVLTNTPVPRAVQSTPAKVATFETPIGQIDSFALSDGTILTLGAQSQIETAFSATERRLILIQGDAYFDVEPDPGRPFIVQMGPVKATALGTEFDVRLSDGTISVAVAEGRVEVTAPYVLDGRQTGLKRSATLEAAQQIRSTQTAGLESVQPIMLSAIAAWRADRLLYDGASLKEIAADVSRYSAIPIIVDDTSARIAGIRVRGSFKADDIDAMLETLSGVYNLEIDRNTSDPIVIRDAEYDDN